jgi:simple sugar transport system ATP-binding protein
VTGAQDSVDRATTPLLRMTGIRKEFGPVVALDGVDFTVRAREIHGLLGGNGAGKTTLMNVLYGLYAADRGTIEIDGAPVAIGSPKDAIRAGIGMVHQSFLQVDTFTVTENVVLGTENSADAAARARVLELSERFGLAVDPDRKVEDLPVGVRQRVEILKALYRGAKILVLDEPTTNLTPQEVDALFSSMKAIVDEGMSVILITHKIRETMAVCGAMTVMRDGRRVATFEGSATTADELAASMVGESSSVGDPRNSSEAAVILGGADVGETVLDTPDVQQSVRVLAQGIEIAGVGGGTAAIAPCSLRIQRGEIVGIAGVAGNGQVELAEALTGVRELVAGSFELDGRQLAGRPTAGWLSAGVVYVPEDRQRDGILPDASITENLMLGAQREHSRGGLIDWARARREAAQAIAAYSVRTPSAATAAGQLSGGNIQRVILARAFAHRPKLLVLHNPTRGLDIASTSFVFDRIRAAAAEGCAVVVISEDLDEVIALADRLAVIYSGALVAERPRGAIDPYEIGRLMMGVAA